MRKTACVALLSMYQNVVNDVLRHPTDNPTIGLLLVKGKNKQEETTMLKEPSLRHVQAVDPRLTAVTHEVLNAAKDTLGDKLDKVILFGSYARGDFDSESDVDIFVLADVPHEEANSWSNRIDDRLSDLWFDYDLLVCIHLTSKATFDRYFQVMPYYQNVMKEGVELHG